MKRILHRIDLAIYYLEDRFGPPYLCLVLSLALLTGIYALAGVLCFLFTHPGFQ